MEIAIPQQNFVKTPAKCLPLDTCSPFAKPLVLAHEDHFLWRSRHHNRLAAPHRSKRLTNPPRLWPLPGTSRRIQRPQPPLPLRTGKSRRRRALTRPHRSQRQPPQPHPQRLLWKHLLHLRHSRPLPDHASRFSENSESGHQVDQQTPRKEKPPCPRSHLLRD